MPLHEVSCCTKHKFVNEGESGEFQESQNSSNKGFTITNPDKKYAPHLHIEPTHLDITIDATHLEEKFVDIKLTYSLENNTAGASTIIFNGIDFADVRVSGDGKPDHTYDGKELQVCFAEPFGAVHERRALTITYRVAHPLVGLHFSVPDEKYPQRPLFAMTDHETEKARYWLACVDYPTVRTSLAYHITAKKGLVVVANGLHERDEAVDETRVTSHWRLEQRCPSYLICWAAGDFQIEHDQDVHGIPIAYVAPRNVSRDVLRSSFAATPSIMNFLETRLGVPFPFPKYYQIAVPGVLGGAMENITLTSWSVFFLCDETWGKEFQLSLDEVNVHEMAHSYFGDSVVIRHFEHVWLKESWATYMESVWLEQHRGDDEFRYEMYQNLNSYVSECNSYVRPMVERRYDHSWDMYDSHTYPGGAWRIHMLRRLLGDDAFWAGVKDYLTTYAGRVAETDDFRKCLEKYSGTNLTKFFDQWYYSAGYPKLKGSYEFKKETNRVKVTLEQTQVDDKSGVALFDIAPVVEIVDEAGKTYRATVVFEGARGSVVMQLDSKPVSVVVDPDYSLLHTLDFNPGTELLKHTLVHSASVPHRVWAAKELIKNGSYQSFKAVEAAMKTEKFYAVVGETGAALAKSKSPFALDVLVSIITSTPLVKAQTLTNLAALSVRHPKIRAAFREYLTRPNLPYRANARALHGLGKQRNEEDVALLIEWAQRPDVLQGMHAIVLSGALRGLGDSQSHKAWEYLYHAVDEGVLPELARGVAIDALGEISKIDEQCKEKARVKLEQFLAEENYSVRKSAINALVTLKSSANAIRAALISHQDAPWLQRKLKSLAEAKSGEEVKSELSDVTARLHELEKQVQLLKENKPLH